MRIETVYKLNLGYEDEGECRYIEIDDSIKIHLHSGEIMIGSFESADSVSLCLNRDDVDIWIDFEDLINVEKIN